MANENGKGCEDCKKRKQRWREDFPIAWESDNYVTRREMVKFLALGSLLLAGANFFVAGVPKLVAAPTYPRKRIAGAAELASAPSLLFRYPTEEDPCILVKEKDGTPVAYSQVCTHLSCAVIYDAKDEALFCPCHHGYFTVNEGRPYAGPPTRPLPRIKLERQGDEIFAVGVEV